MTHRNARLTPVTRAELVEQVLAGWPQAEVEWQGGGVQQDHAGRVGLPATVLLQPHERLDALPGFLAYYNHRRPHGGIGGATPASRL